MNFHIFFLLFTCFISIIFAFTEFPDSTFRRVSCNFMHVSTPFVCAVIEFPYSNIFITGCTGNCLIGNFRCNNWRKYCQNDDISISLQHTWSHSPTRHIYSSWLLLVSTISLTQMCSWYGRTWIAICYLLLHVPRLQVTEGLSRNDGRVNDQISIVKRGMLRLNWSDL